MEKKNFFGEKLKQLRKENKLNQTDFGNTIGVDQSTIAKVELGKAELKFETLIKISEKYNVSLDYLFNIKQQEVVNTNEQQLGTDQRAIQKLAESLDDADAAQVYNYMLFVIDQKGKKLETYEL